MVDFWMSVAKCERKFNLAKTFLPRLTIDLELRWLSFRSSWFWDAMAEICFAVSSLLRSMACLQHEQ